MISELICGLVPLYYSTLTPIDSIPVSTGQHHTNSQPFSCMRMKYVLPLRACQAETKTFTKKIQMTWVRWLKCTLHALHSTEPYKNYYSFLYGITDQKSCSEKTTRQDCHKLWSGFPVRPWSRFFNSISQITLPCTISSSPNDQSHLFLRKEVLIFTDLGSCVFGAKETSFCTPYRGAGIL